MAHCTSCGVAAPQPPPGATAVCPRCLAAPDVGVTGPAGTPPPPSPTAPEPVAAPAPGTESPRPTWLGASLCGVVTAIVAGVVYNLLLSGASWDVAPVAVLLGVAIGWMVGFGSASVPRAEVKVFGAALTLLALFVAEYLALRWSIVNHVHVNVFDPSYDPRKVGYIHLDGIPSGYRGPSGALTMVRDRFAHPDLWRFHPVTHRYDPYLWWAAAVAAAWATRLPGRPRRRHRAARADGTATNADPTTSEESLSS